MGNDIWGGETNPACLANIKKKAVNLNSQKPPTAAQESSELKDAQQSLGDEILKSSTSENYNDEILGANLDQAEAASSQTGSSGANSGAFGNAGGLNFGSSLGGANGSSNFTAASGGSNSNASGGGSNFNGSYDEGYSASSKIAAKAYDINKAYAFYVVLGAFGAHRFYLGRIVSAVFQLLGGLGFIIWVALAAVSLLAQSDLFGELAAQLRPDSDLTASDVQEIFTKIKNPFMVFSLPNVIFLIWLISDFFKLGSMVREQNARLGLGDVDFVYEWDDRSAENLSNAKVSLYIALGLNLLNVAAVFIDSVKSDEVSNISFIATICFAVGLYFASRSMRSKRLLFNFTIFGVFWYLNTLVLVGRVFFENSMLLTALATFCTAIFLPFALLVCKELSDCSGEKTYLRAFYVFALLSIIDIALSVLNSSLYLLASNIGSVIAAIFGIGAVYGTTEFRASRNNYDLAHLGMHVRQMNNDPMN
ncbi:NINE protein [uncultured Campylobacter sp.]|uniref:TM2 domain-containing protein n=1 Tax=uncultured Campylobacter sp. TaxID=218934 RepID=UPI00260ADD2A|nr:NINE protein [uncultured Campylobacter sp.]